MEELLLRLVVVLDLHGSAHATSSRMRSPSVSKTLKEEGWHMVLEQEVAKGDYSRKPMPQAECRCSPKTLCMAATSSGHHEDALCMAHKQPGRACCAKDFSCAPASFGGPKPSSQYTVSSCATDPPVRRCRRA